MGNKVQKQYWQSIEKVLNKSKTSSDKAAKREAVKTFCKVFTWDCKALWPKIRPENWSKTIQETAAALVYQLSAVQAWSTTDGCTMCPRRDSVFDGRALITNEAASRSKPSKQYPWSLPKKTEISYKPFSFTFPFEGTIRYPAEIPQVKRSRLK